MSDIAPINIKPTIIVREDFLRMGGEYTHFRFESSQRSSLS